MSRRRPLSWQIPAFLLAAVIGLLFATLWMGGVT